MFGQRDTSVSEEAVTAPSAPAVPAEPATAPLATPTLPSFSSSSLDIPTPSAPSPTPAPTLPTTPAAAAVPVVNTPEPIDESTAEELVAMKQEALKHLQPLVDTLQQSPEEEFRTLMMMIQATDDRSLLKKALEAAKKISDDKIRAQAMLDVINEINYFTQSAPAD